jgi:2'-5' RNA ligase
MAYSFEMYFDKRSEEMLLRIQQKLKAGGLPSFMLAEGGRPHISLCVYDDLDPVRAEAALRGFCAKENRFKVRLDFIGTFISKENVVFVAPPLTDELRTIHLRFLQAFKDLEKSAWPHYLPGSWQPHCTMGLEISESEFGKVFTAIRENFQPMEATVESIGLVRFRPLELMFQYPLRA